LIADRGALNERECHGAQAASKASPRDARREHSHAQAKPGMAGARLLMRPSTVASLQRSKGARP
jgi:hypothetical protein